jgi:hypothetical protein
MRNIANHLISIMLFVLLVFATRAQTENKNEFINSEIITDSDNIPLNSSTLYFPLKLFNDSTTIKEKYSFIDSWYSEMLFSLHEPLLYNRIESKEIYRFTWLRSFHHPVAIRIEKTSNGIKLFVKQSSGAGGYQPGKIIVDTVKYLTIQQWTTFTTFIEKINFWKLPIQDNDVSGSDGAEWILEGTNKESYHFVTRWSPDEKRFKEFKDCCEYLLTLSGLQIKKRDQY